MRRTSVLLSTLAALALAGCLSFGAKPPPTLMRLTAEAARPAEASRTARPRR